MGLANYTELIASINARAGWLHRDDLSAIAPDWVTICETTINMGDLEGIGVDGLRTADMETAWTTASTSPGVATVTLPTDFLEFRKLYLTYNGIRTELRQRSIIPMTLAERSLVQSIPQRYWIQGSTLYLDPIPNSTYALTGDYYAKVGPLSVSGTNWLMTAAPMVYLCGSIAHGGPWLGRSFDVTPWANGFKIGMAQVRRADIRRRGFGNVQPPVEATYINRGRYNIQTGL